MRSVFAALLLIVVSAGCATTPPIERPGTVTHVVVVWLKHPGDAGLRQILIDRSKTFTQIPGVQRIQVGMPLPSGRPMVDASFDVALTITFKDEAALRAYNDHPIHKRAVQEALEPLAGKVVIYDYINN